MRLRPIEGFVLALGTTLLAACGSGGEGTASLDTEEQKASYGIGRNIGQQLAPAEGRLDMAAFSQGVRDAMAGREAALSDEEIQTALQAFSASVQQAETERREQEATANREEGEAYLASNAEREGVVTTESGLQYEVLTEGTGPRPSPEDQVRIHYEGKLIDGTVFDSSLERGEPAVFPVQGVIDGFTEALLLMPVGSKYRVVIPSDLAYGPQPRPGGPIGPDETLIFEIELLGIE